MADGSNLKKNFNPLTLILIAIIIVGGGIFLYMQLNQPETGIKTESNLFMGDDEAAEYKNEMVPSMRLTMSSRIYCEKKEDGTFAGKVSIENNNDFQYMIRFIMADTNEVIYETGLIPPGGKIEEIPVNMKLEPGTYAVNAIFTAISEKDNQTDLGSSGLNTEMVVP